MKQILSMIIVMILVSACAAAPQGVEPPTQPTVQPTLDIVSELSTLAANTAEIDEVIVVTQSPPEDFFTGNNIALSLPVCSGLTPPQMEGPYYTAETPERNSLLEEGMPGTRLLPRRLRAGPGLPAPAERLAGFLAGGLERRLRQCRLPSARTPIHRLAGTLSISKPSCPGLYSSRPIEHIHVKVRPEGGAEVTSQLYFPDQPVEGLTVTLEERGGYFVGYFNFIVQK